MVLAAATVVSTHLDQTQQQNAESNRWGLCASAAPSAILDHSSLGREAILLPAAEMASAPAFHVVQCLFCFYFCFVTGETLGNSGPRCQRAAPSAARAPSGPAGPAPPALPGNARHVPQLPAEPQIPLPGDSPKHFFAFHFISFPEFSFRLRATRADTAPPRSLGLNPQGINFKLLPRGAGSTLLGS